jgi:hypothetical protein
MMVVDHGARAGAGCTLEVVHGIPPARRADGRDGAMTSRCAP